MSKVELILAGAGTGKTTRLARELQHALESGAVRPEAVLATTFTRQAAAELAERARTRLLTAGRHEDAQRLQAARIGTVNAVCGRLVEQFAFELGLSPDVQVIDEPTAARTLALALATVSTPAEKRKLADLRDRLVELETDLIVARIVAAARANGLDAAAVEASGVRSVASARAVLGQPAPDAEALDRALIEGMAAFADAVPRDAATKGAMKVARICRDKLAKMERGHALEWRTWATLAKCDPTKAYLRAAAPLHAAAAAHDVHPRMHADVVEAIELTFSLAARTLAAYDELKRAWGVIDFADQERHALTLLRRPEVAEQLRDEIDLVLVDEFQDTSPLQLAIFLKLAEIAPRSIWVGDQKQSIYGFRGTDPELMNAAIALLERRDPGFVDDTLSALFEQTSPQTLRESWRSRPLLVALTSEVFCDAFGQHGMPRERVELTPGHREDAPELGSIVELWTLRIPDKRRTTDYALALATAIDTMLAEGAQVRDPATGVSRTATLADVAVLARRKKVCAELAEALEDRGRRVVLPRPGLLATAEGRVTTAALRRWVDPRDDLAAAELSRVLQHPDDPDVWLSGLVRRVDDPNAALDKATAALDDARRRHPGADPITALEGCIAAIGLRDHCRSWGEARQRLGNLDALAGHAEAYVDRCRAERGAPTVTGLLAHLDELREVGQDEQAVLAGDEAITLSTWHAAKGLEWPITILFDLEWMPAGDANLVEVEPGTDRLDLRDPLHGRWIRFIPTPYQWNQTTGFSQRLAAQSFSRRSAERSEREQLRLLYVAWTRARDRLVLAGDPAKMFDGVLARLADEDGPMITRPSGETVVWGRIRFALPQRTSAIGDVHPRSTVPGHRYAARTPQEHPPAWCHPSSEQSLGRLVSVQEIGPELPLVGLDVPPSAVGDAVHAFFAADDAQRSATEREAFATSILARYGVAVPKLSTHLVAAADALDAWMRSQWPGCRWRREAPVWHTRPSGTVIRGAVDRVIEHASGCAIVDHKTLLGTTERALADSVLFHGQLATYAEAVTAALGVPLLGCFVHLPLAGKIVELAPLVDDP